MLRGSTFLFLLAGLAACASGVPAAAGDAAPAQPSAEADRRPTPQEFRQHVEEDVAAIVSGMNREHMLALLRNTIRSVR